MGNKNPIEVMQKYCDRCIHRSKCWRPCPTVQAAILFGEEED